MVVAAYRSGREGVAQGLLEKLAGDVVNAGPAHGSTQARVPAEARAESEEEFTKIARELLAAKKREAP